MSRDLRPNPNLSDGFTPSSRNLSAFAGSGGGANDAGVASGKGQETAIMRPPKRIRWNLPDYAHAKLVYTFYTDYAQLEVSTFASNATDLLINLNGCADIIETNALYTNIRDNFTVSTGVNTNLVASGSVGTGNVPKGWTYWAALYEKYTVLNCEYDITATVMDTGNRDTDGPVGIASHFDYTTQLYWFGNEVGTASNDYDTSALVIMSDMGIKHHRIHNTPSFDHKSIKFGATQDLSTVDHREVFQHTWSGNANQQTYEKFAREVTDDDTNTIWTSVISNPSLVHRLRVGVRPISATFATGDKINYCGRLIYTVQFRQKKSSMHGYNMSLIPA
jgi:hypothetical protein